LLFVNGQSAMALDFACGPRQSRAIADCRLPIADCRLPIAARPTNLPEGSGIAIVAKLGNVDKLCVDLGTGSPWRNGAFFAMISL
jgi:hypothetical protein